MNAELPTGGFRHQFSGSTSLEQRSPRLAMWRAIFLGVFWLYALFLVVQMLGTSYGFTIACDLWALLGVGTMLLLGHNPFGWLNGRRILLGGLALGFALGRFGTGYLSMAIAFMPSQLFNSFVMFGIIPPFVMLLLGFIYIAIVGLIVGMFFSLTVGVPAMIANQLIDLERTLAIYRYEQNTLTAYIARFAYWVTNTKPPVQPDTSRGARFADDIEVLTLRRRSGMAFGHHAAVHGPLYLLTDKHIFIQATTRGGKGVNVIIPHLLRYVGSAFVLDPKGENARATARQRGQLNDKVRCLDPFAISGLPQARFNPLSRINPANMVTYSLMLGQAVVMGERDHWIAGAQQLVALVIMYVVTSPTIPADKKDLVLVRRLLLSGIKLVLDEAMKSKAADGLLASLASSFKDTPEKEFGSIVSTAQRETEILDDPAIAACVAASGPGEAINFADWHSGTMTVFLCLSAPRFATFNRWLRLVLTAALDEMTATLNPPPWPVCFMLDEVATLGPMPAIADAVGLAAGYGIQIVSVWQDNAQLHELYKGRWSSFIGNAGVRVIFNLDDYDTAEYWSKFLGSRMEATRSRQVDNVGLSSGGNVGEREARLVTPDELMQQFAAGQMLVLAQGARPIKTQRVPYYDDPLLAGLWDDPRAAPPAAPARQAAPQRASVPAAYGSPVYGMSASYGLPGPAAAASAKPRISVRAATGPEQGT